MEREEISPENEPEAAANDAPPVETRGLRWVVVPTLAGAAVGALLGAAALLDGVILRLLRQDREVLQDPLTGAVYGLLLGAALGAVAGTFIWVVFPYKTGRAPREAVEQVGGGESLQPVLYALAAESAGHQVNEARLAYATLRSNYRIDRVPLDPRARMNAQAVLQTVDQWIGKGFLPAAPREEACIRCEYVPVCGPYEEQRIREKSRAELRDLVRIREMK